MEKNLLIEDFKPLLSDTFIFPVKDQEDITFTLKEVNSLTKHMEEGREPFSLIFQGPASPQIPQGLYILNHAGLGKLTLFLVPVGQGESGLLYESLFN